MRVYKYSILISLHKSNTRKIIYHTTYIVGVVESGDRAGGRGWNLL